MKTQLKIASGLIKDIEKLERLAAQCNYDTQDVYIVYAEKLKANYENLRRLASDVEKEAEIQRDGCTKTINFLMK